jgi:hypothetical protein
MQYVQEIEIDYYTWYEKSVNGLKFVTLPLQYAAFISGIVASLLAAIFTGGTDPLPPIVRFLLIILPALGSSLTTFIVQAKLFERYELREAGRIAIQSYCAEARQKVASLKSDEEVSTFHDELRKRIDEVEGRQSSSFFHLMGTSKDSDK